MVGISVCCKAVRDCMANQLIKHPTQGMDALWYRFVHIYIYIYIYSQSHAAGWLCPRSCGPVSSYSGEGGRTPVARPGASILSYIGSAIYLEGVGTDCCMFAATCCWVWMHLLARGRSVAVAMEQFPWALCPCTCPRYGCVKNRWPPPASFCLL